MALPPMRPRTMRNGRPWAFVASASLASAAPTKPTGMPSTAAGFGAPASISSSRRNQAVAEYNGLRGFHLTAGMNHAHDHVGLVLRKVREIGLGADDSERALIDRVAIAQIGFSHDRPRSSASGAGPPREDRPRRHGAT